MLCLFKGCFWRVSKHDLAKQKWPSRKQITLDDSLGLGFLSAHPAAKGVRQKEFGKKVTRKVTETSEKGDQKVTRKSPENENRGRVNREVQTVN